MTVEDRLAAHIAQLKYEELSREALSAVDWLFLDTATSMLSGFADAECRQTVDRLLRFGGLGPFTVVGHPGGADASIAVLANGMFAGWCRRDAHDRTAGIYRGAVIFPVLLAAAEAYGLTDGDEAGREFVTTVVAAYDVADRVGEAMNVHPFQGLKRTGSAVSIAAAGGAARLMGLGETGILSAMGIAAIGGGLSRQPLADRVNGKNALCGMAAKSAIDAARMAAAGIVGAPNFFAGLHGLSALEAGGRADLALLLGDLGQRFSVLDAAACACCGSAFSSFSPPETPPANVIVFSGERRRHVHSIPASVVQPAGSKSTVVAHARSIDRISSLAGRQELLDEEHEKPAGASGGFETSKVGLLWDAALDLRSRGPATVAAILQAARSTSSAA